MEGIILNIERQQYEVILWIRRRRRKQWWGECTPTTRLHIMVSQHLLANHIFFFSYNRICMQTPLPIYYYGVIKLLCFVEANIMGFITHLIIKEKL